MKFELEQQLVQKYPSIFREYGGDPKATCMAFGIECNSGWFDLIDTLCNFIEGQVGWINAYEPTAKFGVVAAQVKEKYGTLNFYCDYVYATDLPPEVMRRVDDTINFISGAIILANRMSGTICESCGAKGSIDQDCTWLMCRCPECSRKEGINGKTHKQEDAPCGAD